jgi:hypothetical protein
MKRFAIKFFEAMAASVEATSAVPQFIDLQAEKALSLAPYNASKKRRAEFFLATQYGCYWFSIPDGKPKVHICHCWFDLSSMALQGEEITFLFDDCFAEEPRKSKKLEVIFSGPEACDIFSVVHDFLCTILNPGELPDFSRDGQEYSPPTNVRLFDPLLRFILRYRRRKELKRLPIKKFSSKRSIFATPKYPSDTKVSIFRTFLGQRPNKLPFDLLPSEVHIVLGCLGLIPSVHTLVVSGQMTPHEQRILGSFIMHNRTITALEFTNGFPLLAEIAEAFAAKKSTGRNPIRSFVFASVPLNRSHLMALLGFLPTITRLDFHNSMQRDVVPSFHELAQSSALATITHLGLDRCAGINIDIVLAGLPRLRVLSVNECGLELSVVMESIDRHREQLKLTEISLAGNKGRDVLRATLNLPPNLRVVNAGFMQWNVETLLVFWDAMLASCVHRLNLEAAALTSEQWRHFHGALAPAGGASLTGLVWSENPVSPPFFRAMAASPQLRTLDVSGSLTRADPSLECLAIYLAEAQSLEELILCGSARNYLQLADLRVIFDGLKVNTSIVRITICDHFAGPGMLVPLAAALAANRRVAYVKVDGNDLYNLDAIFRFMASCQARGVALEVAWPEEEVAHVLRENPTLAPRVPALRELFDAVLKGSAETLVPPEEALTPEGFSLPKFDPLTGPSSTEVMAYEEPDITADQLEIPAWIAGPAGTRTGSTAELA